MRAFIGSVYRAVRSATPRPIHSILDGTLASIGARPSAIRHFDLSVGLLRQYLQRKPLSVGWLLDGDEDDAAARLHGLLPHSYLRDHGVNSVILRKPRQGHVALELRPADIEQIIQAGFDIVVFQRFQSHDAEELARALQAVGTRTVYVEGEFFNSRMPMVVDELVVGCETLKELNGVYSHKTSVIESPIETSPDLVKDSSRPPQRNEIRVVWVGYPENLHLLAPVKDALKDPRLSDFRLVTISRGPDVSIQWNRRRVWGQLLDCDIGVLPAPLGGEYHFKPNTRMTMLKALGLPIVASPLPSYVQTLTHGRSCYFARSAGEWAENLAALADFARRREIGLADRDRILATYGLNAIGRRWLALFQRLANRR
jgi:glycosyltransferase involved in cell wall biosynthesis